MHITGSHSLPRGRYSGAHRIYLVTAVVDGRRDVFADYSAGRILIAAMRHEDSTPRVKSLAFVVMPDHFHWVLRLRSSSDLSTCVGRVKSMSARMINKRRGHCGRLWQDGFHDRALTDEKDLVNIARYVLANPLRAGLVKSIRDYPLWDAVWV